MSEYDVELTEKLRKVVRIESPDENSLIEATCQSCENTDYVLGT